MIWGRYRTHSTHSTCSMMCHRYGIWHPVGPYVADVVMCCPDLSFKTEALNFSNWHKSSVLRTSFLIRNFLKAKGNPYQPYLGSVHIQWLVRAGVQRPDTIASIHNQSAQPSQLQGSTWQQLKLLFQLYYSSTSPSTLHYFLQSCTAGVPKRTPQQTFCMKS